MLEKNKEQQQNQAEDDLWNAPLNQIRPSQAMLTGEIAYATSSAKLQKNKPEGHCGKIVPITRNFKLLRTTARQAIDTISTGELLITNQRIIFSGSPKSFALTLNSLVNITNYEDAISFMAMCKTWLEN